MQPPRVIEFSTVREPTAEYMEYLWEKSVLLWSLVSQTVSYRRKMICKAPSFQEKKNNSLLLVIHSIDLKFGKKM